MTCEHFLESYSDYVDGLLDESAATACEAHAEACASCSRYSRVMQEAVGLFRELPPAEPAGDFTPRLQHRLYHVEDNIPWAAAHPGGSAAILAVAAVGMLSLFWLPFATRIPVEVEFPPVAVEVPENMPVHALFLPGPHLDPPAQPALVPTGAAMFLLRRPRLVVPTTLASEASSRPGR